jgi:hypothetical protein
VDDYFIISADEDGDGLVEKGDSGRVGVYELVGYATVENKTEVRKELVGR